jgi:hypothetical protein
MSRVWVTNGSTRIAPVVNPLAAACDHGYVPSDIFILDNPKVEDVTESVTTLVKTVVTAHGGEEPEITVETIDDELDFEAIISYLRSSIKAGADAGDEVAVDVTPGRKFWSSISFRAGFEYDLDHIYYIHVPGEYFGELYPTIPRTSIKLIDFTEVA